jgi:hypothetical protein
MDYEQDQQENQGVMQRIKESPRTVSALIIILIVAAAIYAFSGDKNKQGSDDNGSLLTESSASPQASSEGSPSESAAPSASPVASPSKTSVKVAAPVVNMSPVSADQLSAQAKALPAGEKTANAYVEKAQRGDSLTVLARRATTRYLSENSAGYAVTNEHRIYMEDYIKDHMQRHPVAVGQSETISFNLVTDAVASASHLSNSQLQHLSKYTSRVRF